MGRLTRQDDKLCVSPAIDSGFEEFGNGAVQGRYCVVLAPQQQQRSPHIVKDGLRPRTGGTGDH